MTSTCGPGCSPPGARGSSSSHSGVSHDGASECVLSVDGDVVRFMGELGADWNCGVAFDDHNTLLLLLLTSEGGTSGGTALSLAAPCFLTDGALATLRSAMALLAETGTDCTRHGAFACCSLVAEALRRCRIFVLKTPSRS